MLALAFACVPALAEDWNYRVRPGDTLWDLGGTYLKSDIHWQQLQQHNRIDDPYRLAPGSRLRIPLDWLRQQPAQAHVIALAGEVIAVDPKGRQYHVSAGMNLVAGSRLLTAAGASLSLQFADGSCLRLRERSELVLDRMSRYGPTGMVDTRLRLQRGRVSNEVRRLRGPGAYFIVDTPTASSAVRGTRFRIHASEHGTQAEVLEGRVAVNAGPHALMLERGFGTRALAGHAAAPHPVALLPAPDLSGMHVVQDRLQPRFSWPAVNTASGYRILISQQPDFAVLLAELDSPVPSITAPALPPGQYHVRISAVDQGGLEGRDADARFQVDDRPAPPYTVAPTPGSVVRQTQLTLRWTQAPSARGYRYEVADNPEFQHPVASGTDVHGQSITLPQALVPGVYYWRVSSLDAQGQPGPFTDAVDFTLRPLAPINTITVDQGPRHARDISFHWQSGQPGQHYRFQLSRSPTFERLRTDAVVEQPGITLPRLPGGTWYLRAQAIDTNGEVGAFAPAQKIKLPCRLCRAGLGAGAVLILLSL